MLNPKTLVFLDLETTGFSPKYNRVTEIGVVVVKGNHITDEYQRLVNPDQWINPAITKITGITQKDVLDAPYFNEIANELLSYLKLGLLTAHNANFDYRFLQAEFFRSGIEFNSPRLCTMTLSRQLFPTQKSHRLEEILRIHNIKVKRHHRALDDARATAQFYLKVKKEIDNTLFIKSLNSSTRIT